MDCINARQRWHRRHDEGASDGELDAHLASCESCRVYAAGMQRLVGLMDELREDTEHLVPPAIVANLHSAPRPRRAWSTPSVRNLLRIAATIVIIIGAGLWFRMPERLMLVDRTTETAVPALQGITLRAESRERFIAVAAPSHEPNVQTFWLYPMVNVTEGQNGSAAQ